MLLRRRRLHAMHEVFSTTAAHGRQPCKNEAPHPGAAQAVEAAARKAAAEEADTQMADADAEEGALPGPPAGALQSPVSYRVS